MRNKIPYLERFKIKFESRIDKSPGLGPHKDCWEWRGTIKRALSGNRGVIRFKNKMHYAHRIALMLSTGSMPSYVVCHMCDNPICVRPDHLVDASQKFNMLDMMVKERNPSLLKSLHRVEDINQLKIVFK